jgi:hypothetical protein
MCILPITGDDYKPKTWWFNFLYQLPSEKIIRDLSTEFAKWNAELISTTGIPEVKDSLAFQNENDMTWFLLHWS